MNKTVYGTGVFLLLCAGVAAVFYISYSLKNSVASTAVEKVVQNYFSAVEVGDASSSSMFLTSALQAADPNLYAEGIATFGSVKSVAQTDTGAYAVGLTGQETYVYHAEVTSVDGNKSDATIYLVKQNDHWYINGITSVPKAQSPFGQ